MQTENFSNLPDSWQVKTLGEVCEIVSKGATPKNQHSTADKNSAIFLKAENVTQSGFVNLDNTKFIDFETHTKTLKRSMLKNLDILITIAGSLAHCAVLEVNPKQQININQAVSFARLNNTKEVNPHFIKYYIMNPATQLYLLSKAKTTAVPNLTLEIIRDIKIPLPPLDIQKRIVARLDEAFARIDSGIKHLKSAKANLTKYKQSLLKSAFNGTLTKEPSLRGSKATEAIHSHRHCESLRQKGEAIHKKDIDCHDWLTQNLAMTDKESSNLPQGWTIKTLGEIAFVTKLAGFEYTKYIYPNLTDFGIPLFKGKNIQGNKIVLEFESHIPKEISNQLKRSRLNKKCILTPYVGSIGNVAIFDGNFEAHLGSNVGKIEILDDNTLEEYVYYFLQSGVGYLELTKHKKATAQESISIAAIRDIKIPLPPLQTQKQIVGILEKHFKSTDKTSAILDSTLKNAKQLKSSLLKSAFTGELV